MALENLEPATRIESILDGENIAPATRLEYFLKQAAAGGNGLPAYDDEDIGKVLTVGSEYETTGEAIQTQSVALVDSVGTLDAQKVDASNWTDGQLVSVVFNGTTYVLEIADIEGSLSVGNEHFQLYYNSVTGVMTIEAIDAVSPVTVSAQYLEEQAHADWAEPSGVTGNFVPMYNMNEILRNSIEVVSDIDGTVVEYTSGELIVAVDYENNEISCRLADTTLLNTPIVVIDDDEGFKTVLSTNVMFNNDGDINQFVPPENANAEPTFYVKEISPNAKCLVLESDDYILRVIDANSVTIGYGYIKKTN